MRYGADRQAKLYYGISEVCAMTGLEKHILRYWESEFPQLRPRKNRAGNRVYRARDIEVVKRIQMLLQVERFTMEGARQKLREWGQQHGVEEKDSESTEVDVPLDDDVGDTPHILSDEPQPPIGLPAERADALLRELQTVLRMLR